MGNVFLGSGSFISTGVLVETPESIDLEAEPAGIVVRGLAFTIDFLIRAIVLFVLGLALAFSGEAGMGVMLISWFLLEWFYPVFFEVFRAGQTPGKKKMGLRVVNDDLTPVGWGTSMIRNLLRWADFFPVLYTAGLATMAWNRYSQRLGDLAAGTLVIYSRKESMRSAGSDIRANPPPFQLEREDQVAFVGFAQRSQQLSEQRQQELADILGPLLPVHASQRVDYVRAVGQWLLGGRQ
ncbi:RDD family protein [Proteobacteria bacterium 005FR1]|nr:RDD family protein [Proteobacteria bacterium 005FR1]